ncbi:carbamoyl phosphate synthase small subunit [Salirhabdus salicampi]|uniref:carbamoyl phosphate synthase small subunit n=1 Tax=Salirhabdus salicampi TaxID=476102 RepID=UPI0020C291B3|nr:carbamoyl phosphate synthase small subunit [Salirhabdus salicampi]MCP8617321.1 carbamoyl phosphate synthase small subunit [Salirhabdus salicampi]
MEKGYLLLETGDVFEGILFGNNKETIGEVVFNTSMTGYQEIISDPSYTGQIITFCYPMIGNYGINHKDFESVKLNLSGVIVGEMCEHPSHYLQEKTLHDELAEAGVTGLHSIDTRTLVKLIRKQGTLKGTITTSLPEDKSIENYVKAATKQITKTPVADVSTKKLKTYEGDGHHVVLMDFGYKKSILNALLEAKCKVTVVPHNYTYEEVKALNPDGILLSNGPGDPLQLSSSLSEIKKIIEAYPTLGVCLGHQLIALAYGASTEKLTFGHRGGNHPVKELHTGKVWMTAQNHGYVVVENSIDKGQFNITYRNVNDGTLEGLEHKTLPIQSVQFHPEAHPGPTDTDHIFQKFMKQLKGVGEKHYAVT